MADPHRGMRCWCIKCDREVFFRDGWMCRHCDPVERINALAECIWYANKDGNMLLMTRDVKMTYIHAADIILESE